MNTWKIYIYKDAILNRLPNDEKGLRVAVVGAEKGDLTTEFKFQLLPLHG